MFLDLGDLSTDEPKVSYAVKHELYDRRAAAGVAAARGEVLAMLEDTAVPAPDWCDQVLVAHRLPYGVIGGAVEHTGRGALNWAVYFQDFGRYQLPLREGPAQSLTDVNVSYKREALEPIRKSWAERYNEVVVHGALTRNRVVLWLRPQIVAHLDRGQLSLSDLVIERFWWGRLYGATCVRTFSPAKRLFYILFGPLIPIVIVGRMAIKVFGGRRNRGRFMGALPSILVLAPAWCLGELVGYVTGRAAPSGHAR